MILVVGDNYDGDDGFMTATVIHDFVLQMPWFDVKIAYGAGSVCSSTARCTKYK